jgi:hypothetical protein
MEANEPCCITTVCAWCGNLMRVGTGNGGNEPVVKKQISHGLCDPCHKRLTVQAAALVPSTQPHRD